MMQRRRRLEEDVNLVASLGRRADDLKVLADWLQQGEAVEAELASGLDELQREVEAGEVKKMLGGEHDARNAIISIHPGRRRHRVAGLGRDAAAHVPALGRAARLQDRRRRLPARRRGRRQVGDRRGDRRIRLRPADGRGRRPSPGPHLAVRLGQAPPHLVRLALRLARAAGGRRHRHRRQGPARRHVSIERRRRPARQRHRLGDPPDAPADRHRRVVPERAVAAQEPRLGDEGAEVPPLRSQAEGTAGGDGQAGRREEGDRLRQPDPQLRACSRTRW